MKIWQFCLLAGFAVAGSPIARAAPLRAAIFPFTLNDTSLQGEMQGSSATQQHRLATLAPELAGMLMRSGCCTIVDISPVAAQAKSGDLEACGGCAVDLARKLGAQVSIVGWVQKVSDLILNINIVVRDVTTGHLLNEASVDIRGNTDESWSRGLAYLWHDRLHDHIQAPGPSSRQ